MILLLSVLTLRIRIKQRIILFLTVFVRFSLKLICYVPTYSVKKLAVLVVLASNMKYLFWLMFLFPSSMMCICHFVKSGFNGGVF